jgi:hypothetical protein
MGQQTVLAHSYAQAQRNPVKRNCGEESRPAEEEQGSDRASVKSVKEASDIQLIPSLLTNGLALVSIGCSLYWTARMRASSTSNLF